MTAPFSLMIPFDSHFIGITTRCLYTHICERCLVFHTQCLQSKLRCNTLQQSNSKLFLVVDLLLNSIKLIEKSFDRVFASQLQRLYFPCTKWCSAPARKNAKGSSFNKIVGQLIHTLCFLMARFCGLLLKNQWSNLDFFSFSISQPFPITTIPSDCYVVPVLFLDFIGRRTERMGFCRTQPSSKTTQCQATTTTTK